MKKLFENLRDFFYVFYLLWTKDSEFVACSDPEHQPHRILRSKSFTDSHEFFCTAEAADDSFQGRSW